MTTWQTPCALVVSACSCQSAAEPCYRALAGKNGMVECQCLGDIVAVLPWLELAAVDVVVAHASAAAKSYAAQAAKTTGWTAARAEQTKRARFRKDVPDNAAFRFVLFAVETCGYMGKVAVKLVSRLGDIAAESGRIPKDACCFVPPWPQSGFSLSLFCNYSHAQITTELAHFLLPALGAVALTHR